ncbi:MAG: acetate--CoA ligase family protein [Candidatus Helarchaeota archaeon]
MNNGDFNSLFKPQSIAIMGASNNVQTFGTMHLLNLIAGGYPGKIFPIHPKHDKILGLRAYKKIEDVPSQIDLCLIVLPTKIVVEKLRECGRAGVKSIIIVSAGFNEVGNDEDAEKIRQVAKKYKINIVGVNCIGEVIPSSKIFLSPMPIYPKAGSVALISQSGSYAVHPLISNQDLRYSKIISVGNETCLDIVDFLEYCGKDPETNVIGLYIEGFKGDRGKKFVQVAREISSKKPILGLVIGSTEAGSRAASSHTGAIAGQTKIIDAIFKQTGVIQVETGLELLHSLMCFSNQPIPKGDRFAVLTVGGGPGTVFADLLEKNNVQVPRLSEELQEKLKNILPETAGYSNPVDLTFDRDWSNLYKKVPKLLLKSDEIDGIVLYGIFGIGFFNKIVENENIDLSFINNNEEMIDLYKSIVSNELLGLIKLGKKYDKPIVGSSVFRRNDDPIIQFCQDNGLPVFILEESIKPIVNMVEYARWKKKNNNIN